MMRILPGAVPPMASAPRDPASGTQADFLGALGLAVRNRPGEGDRDPATPASGAADGSVGVLAPGIPLAGPHAPSVDRRTPASDGSSRDIPVPLPAIGASLHPMPDPGARAPTHGPISALAMADAIGTPAALPAQGVGPLARLAGPSPGVDSMLGGRPGEPPLLAMLATAPTAAPASALIVAPAMAAPGAPDVATAPAGLPSLLLPQGLLAHGRLSYLQRGDAAAPHGASAPATERGRAAAGATIAAGAPTVASGAFALPTSGAGAPIAQAQALRAQDAARRESRIGGPDAPPAREALASSSYARRALHTQVDEDGSLRCWARDYTLSEHEREGLALGLVAEAASRGQSLQRVVINGVLAWQRPQD